SAAATSQHQVPAVSVRVDRVLGPAATGSNAPVRPARSERRNVGLPEDGSGSVEAHLTTTEVEASRALPGGAEIDTAGGTVSTFQDRRAGVGSGYGPLTARTANEWGPSARVGNVAPSPPDRQAWKPAPSSEHRKVD